MAVFHLDRNYSASFIPYKARFGYVAKGTIFHHGEVVEIFEARGRSVPDMEKAAWAKAFEVYRRLMKREETRRKER